MADSRLEPVRRPPGGPAAGAGAGAGAAGAAGAGAAGVGAGAGATGSGALAAAGLVIKTSMKPDSSNPADSIEAESSARTLPLWRRCSVSHA